MDAKEAAAQAKAYVVDVFGAEQLVHVALEEIDFDERRKQWLITIGFFRPWSQPANVGMLDRDPFRGRIYKQIRINDNDRRVRSVKERVFAASD